MDTAKRMWSQSDLNKEIDNHNFKTLFGNQNILGKGNIDLFKHNIKGTSGNSTFYLRIYSSNNLKANSLISKTI